MNKTATQGWEKGSDGARYKWFGTKLARIEYVKEDKRWRVDFDFPALRPTVKRMREAQEWCHRINAEQMMDLVVTTKDDPSAGEIQESITIKYAVKCAAKDCGAIHKTSCDNLDHKTAHLRRSLCEAQWEKFFDKYYCPTCSYVMKIPAGQFVPFGPDLTIYKDPEITTGTMI